MTYSGNKGLSAALGNKIGLLSQEAQKVLDDYRRLNSLEAKRIYGKHWVAMLSESMKISWPALYELLQVIKEEKIYSLPDNRPASTDKMIFTSFREFFENVVKEPFLVWSELETTYHFVTENAPELLQRPYEEAAKYAQLNANGVKKETLNSVSCYNYNTIPDTALNRGTNPNYILARLNRDANNGLVYETGLAAQDILTGYEQGEYSSARQAGIAAGFVKDVKRIQVLPIPEKIAAKIKEFLNPAQIQELIRLLQDD